MSRKILLPIEVSSRELFSKLLLAHRFSSKGCTTFVGDKSSILEISKYTPNSIYFDKGYHKGVSESIYKKLKSNGIKIVSMDEENAVDFIDYQQINLRFPDSMLKQFDLIFLWGVKQFDYLRKNRINFNKRKIITTGHPRFELLKHKYKKSIYESTSRKYVKEYGDFILINTNFGLGNNIKGKEFVVENYGSRFPQIKSLINYQEKQVNNFIELCFYLSKKSNKRIVLRPHPEEDVGKYEKRLKELSNVNVVSEGSVIPWIMASKIMIHHDCTTSIECAMLKKNSIAYVKDLDRDLTTDIPLRISYIYENMDDLIKHTNQCSKHELKIDNSILVDYFSFYNNSLDNIVELTISLFAGVKNKNKNFFFYMIVSLIKEKLRVIFKKTDCLFEKKIDGLDIENIQVVIKKYNKIFNEDVVVKKVHKRLYCIKKAQ